ncbi:holo-ACP synthase [Paenibacillus sp. 481]|uniref:holo-ACP synthase n=1 Tax=Paenibacillus sp. 481 TaxID=2835869 RepID=UPI001E35F390|nr:holo-ACP synthase [Paenibacillus sp. 481]UHA74918.1 holo-ACP synthase [Paenibacillus sp. 481]
MIYGIGHDIVEIERIQRILSGDISKRFIARLLTSEEQVLHQERGGRQTEFVAGRFAAKEAVVKAIGTGIGAKVGFQDIEVLPDHLGKPYCRLSERAWSRLGLSAHEYVIHISISHQPNLASAYAIMEHRSYETEA